MEYLGFGINSGEVNMQIDKDLLDTAIAENISTPRFRLYCWSPACVSLGRNQSDDFLDKDFLKSKNIDIVRRLTGGRALLHDKELTYSFVCPISALENGESVINSYKEISGFLVEGFKKLGINLEFPEHKRPSTKFDYCMSISTGADLCFEGKKIIGSAQFRKDGYILQHGSILFDYDNELIEKIFNEQIEPNSISCLRELNPNITLDSVKNALIGLMGSS